MRRRKGLALAGVVVLCLMAGSLLAWLFLSLSWSQESLMAAMRRSEERAVLSSQVEVCRHWVREQLAAGKPPRVAPEHVTGDPGSRKVFEDRTPEGAIAEVYDLEPPPSGPGTLGRPLHSCPKGLLIRAVWPSGPFPSLELETVWVTRDVLLPDGTAATVLDEHPLIWRERWP